MRVVWVFLALTAAIALTALDSGLLTNSARAEESKEISDAAYCSGVIARNIEMAELEMGNSSPSDKQLLERKKTLLEGAMKRGAFAAETANKLIADGRADARGCWEIVKKCVHETTERARTPIAAEVAGRMQDECLLSGKEVCGKTAICK